MLRVAVAGALLVASTFPAFAERMVAVISTERLFEVCLVYRDITEHPKNHSDEDFMKAMECSSTIIAMNTMLNDFSRNGFLKYKFCSNHLGARQIVYQYLKWVSENPAYMGGLASDSFTATMAGYLCDRHPWEAGGQ